MITVTVVRSGGFAGLTRTWTLHLDRAEWQQLLAEQPDDSPDGADRFVYRIRALRREVVIPESRLDGAWRELIERARRTD